MAGVRRSRAVPTDDDRLVERSRAGMSLAPRRREIWATIVIAAAFAITVGAIALWAPDRGGHGGVTAARLGLCYAGAAAGRCGVGPAVVGATGGPRPAAGSRT